MAEAEGVDAITVTRERAPSASPARPRGPSLARSWTPSASR